MMVFTFGGIATSTFSPGGPGAAIVELMLIAAFGSLVNYVVSALGQGQIASMIKLVTVFSCIGIVIAQILKAIGSICRGFLVPILLNFCQK
jgi:hypothetical protein